MNSAFSDLCKIKMLGIVPKKKKMLGIEKSAKVRSQTTHSQNRNKYS